VSIAAVSARSERGPAALLPVWAARLVGFAALACLGVAQWQRMVAGLSIARPLLWVALAVGIAAAVVACDRLAGRRRAVALVGTAFAGLVAAYLASGLELELLRPRRLDDLGSGLGGGAQALSTVRLPYEGADAWPALTLQLLGAEMVMIAGLLAFWPRGEEESGRGYPFLALAVLLIVAATPVVSLGGTRPLWLGAGLTLLTVCFLWLERLPLRPGIGVAALIGLALVGALPLAAAADRGEPWFDYQSFAEGLGPKDPVRFDWGHGDYGPIGWTRTGAEVVRVRAERPSYWKVRTLDVFDGAGWDTGGFDRDSDDPFLDLPPNWESQSRFQDRISVSVQRLRGNDVVGAGTTLDVSDATRPITPGVAPGEWRSSGELRAGDSYNARTYVPRPTAEQLSAVPASPSTEQSDDLRVRVQLDGMTLEQEASLPDSVPRSSIDGRPPDSASIDFAPFGRVGVTPVADYRSYGVSGEGETALAVSDLSRTYELAKRLRVGSSTPYEYVLATSAYLRRGFAYTEKPPAPAPGVHPLESFLFDTKAGYCQHYAAAMALLLRMGGIPARVATGFSPGGFSKRRGAWIVRDTDAHSWVEAWFDGWGWVSVDPTPSATPARSQIAALSAPSAADAAAANDAAAQADGGEGASPSDPRAAGSREELFNQLRGGDGGTAEEAGDATGSGGDVPLWAAIPVGLLVVGGAGALLVRRRRLRPDDPLELAVWELETALRRSGRGADPGVTLRQLERRLGLSGDAAGYLRAVSAGRYAPGGSLPTNAQRRALRRQLASGLGFGGRLRTFWALPPRAR
jgi:transglutaminase-like putative cysteine protease